MRQVLEAGRDSKGESRRFAKSAILRYTGDCPLQIARRMLVACARNDNQKRKPQIRRERDSALHRDYPLQISCLNGPARLNWCGFS